MSKSSLSDKMRPKTDAPRKSVQASFNTADEPTVKTSFDLPKSLHRELKIRAMDEGRPLRALILEALDSYLKE